MLVIIKVLGTATWFSVEFEAFRMTPARLVARHNSRRHFHFFLIDTNYGLQSRIGHINYHSSVQQIEH